MTVMTGKSMSGSSSCLRLPQAEMPAMKSPNARRSVTLRLATDSSVRRLTQGSPSMGSGTRRRGAVRGAGGGGEDVRGPARRRPGRRRRRGRGAPGPGRHSARGRARAASRRRSVIRRTTWRRSAGSSWRSSRPWSTRRSTTPLTVDSDTPRRADRSDMRRPGSAWTR